MIGARGMHHARPSFRMSMWITFSRPPPQYQPRLGFALCSSPFPPSPLPGQPDPPFPSGPRCGMR
jgi:hypothetical protein